VITRETVLQLAPTSIDNDRPSRYAADEQGVLLDALAPADRELVVWLYGYLRELDGIVGDADTTAVLARLRAFIERHAIDRSLSKVRSIGASASADPRLAEVFHDLRGGAMGVLFVQLSRLAKAPHRTDVARSLFIVTLL